MQVLRLLAAARRRQQRRGVSTITAARSEVPDTCEAGEEEEDDGPFFDLDFASSVRASSSTTTSSSGSESDGACSDLDFIISLRRSRAASPAYHSEPAPALFFPQTPLLEPTSIKEGGKQKKKRGTSGQLSTPSFDANSNNNTKAAFYSGRPSFASSARSLRLYMESPTDDEEDDDASDELPHHHNKRGAPSGGVIRRCLAKISRRLRRSVVVRTRGAAAGDTSAGRGVHPHRRLLRKSRSASAAVVTLHAAPASSRDDSVVEKQDGIASAIAHCKESFHRASLSERDSSILRSRSDPGKRDDDASSAPSSSELECSSPGTGRHTGRT